MSAWLVPLLLVCAPVRADAATGARVAAVTAAPTRVAAEAARPADHEAQAVADALTDDETVRIAVGRFPAAVVVEGAPFLVRRGAAVAAQAATRVKFSIGKQGLLIDGKPSERDIALVETQDEAGTLKLAGHRYRQRLEVRYQVFNKKPEILVVHPLDLETYVTGIVSAELPHGWPLAAYQAQAVAARTFAVAQKYRRLDLPYHMEATVIDQVYGGVEREHELAAQAATSTRGLVLTHGRHLANAYFHAACGGRTESAAEGWGSSMEYLPGSSCGKCGDAARYHWKTKVSKKDIDKAFSRLVGSPIRKMSVVERTASGRTRRIKLEGDRRSTTISGSDLRRLLGWSVVWSSLIDKLEFSASGLVVEGRGSGHGVGLCQWGARGMAVEGASWQRILDRYYPGARALPLY